MPKSLKDHHNQGETDRAQGNGYRPPHGILEELVTWPGSRQSKQNIAENDAYRKGWKNAGKT
ncbi:MAG: hypothetical protein KDE03_15130 [Rhodobacteraceae bacterium]|nr:hypothetical protein [Paracoccaceae bacterium]